MKVELIKHPSHFFCGKHLEPNAEIWQLENEKKKIHSYFENKKPIG
jgi:hypothetical protein